MFGHANEERTKNKHCLLDLSYTLQDKGVNDERF